MISIIMGSDSDLKVMSKAAEILDKFKVDYEITIVSAHRTPDLMFNFAKNADYKGIQIIIAGAGGAAHLPGMVASLTHLPVIGVPIKSSSLPNDSLYSIVQMPRGVPVATVGIDNAENAALLAVRILGLNNPELIKTYLLFQEEQTNSVYEKIEKLKNTGYKNYS